MILVLLYLDRDGRLADTACLRRCHASIKSRQTSPTGDERQNTRKSGPSRPTASKRVSSPPVGTIPSASDVTDTAQSKQQASKQAPPPRVYGAPAIVARRRAGGCCYVCLKANGRPSTLLVVRCGPDGQRAATAR